MTETIAAGDVVGMVPPAAAVTGLLPPLLPGVGAKAFAVPVPGPAGRNGEDGADLSPEDLAELTSTVQAEVDESLEPPVDLVLLFENAST